MHFAIFVAIILASLALYALAAHALNVSVRKAGDRAIAKAAITQAREEEALVIECLRACHAQTLARIREQEDFGAEENPWLRREREHLADIQRDLTLRGVSA